MALRKKPYKKQLYAGFLGAIALFGGTSAYSSVALDYSSGFSGACGSSLSCVGSTSISGADLQLTASNWQSGAGYSQSAITLGTGAIFSTTFQFQFTNGGGINPADGIDFVLAKSPTGLGSMGQGMGYQGVLNSVAIEFDTFLNSSVDSSNNHVAININGALTDLMSVNPYNVSDCGSFAYKSSCMSNGDIWTATIGYNGAALTIALQDAGKSVQTLISNYAIDIASILGTNVAYVGFSGGTGAGYETQSILSWQLANDVSLAPVVTGASSSSIDEPEVILLMGVSLMGFGLVKTRNNRPVKIDC